MKKLFKVFTIFPSSDLHRCYLLFLGMLIGAFLDAIGIGAIFPFISIMGQPDWLSQHGTVACWVAVLGVSSHAQFVMLCAWGLIIFYIIKNICLAWQTKQQLIFTLDRQIYYATQLYASYLGKPYMFHLNHNTAVLLRNAYDGPSRTFTELLGATFGLLTEIVTAFVILGMLLVTAPFTAMAMIGMFGGIGYFILRACRKSIGKQGEVVNENAAVMHQWVNQGLGAIKETKILGKEAHFCVVYGEACRKYCYAFRDYRFVSQVPRFVIETTVVVGMLVIVVAKLFMGNMPNEIVPLLGLLALAAFRLMPCVNRSIGYVNAIRFSLPIFEEVYEEFCMIRERRMQGNDKTLFLPPEKKMSFMHELQVSHLTFRYPESQHEVLSDVFLVIPKGSFVGIVGSSGAGKTTFVDLLLGLLDPDKGQILVDGIDIRDNIRAWQSNLAYVPQTIYLVDGTIRENIALGLGDDEIDNNRIEVVLRMAELEEFVANMPDGVETMVGERGVKLSGGQRQRVGLARALYANPEVLILDEATSALDDATEKSITDAILKLKGKITIIAVAHRVTTLTNCDFKVRFEGGFATIEV